MDTSSHATVNPAGAIVANSKADRSTAHTRQEGYGHHPGNPWFLALTALGVVYGDIGTSPLYAFQVALTGIGHPVPTAADVLGIVSLIFWALTADGVAEICRLRPARRQRRRGRHPGAAVAGRGRPDRQRRQAADSGAPRHRRRGVALRRRRHHAGDFGAFGHGGAQAGRAGVREIHRAGDAGDPDRIVRDPALRDREHRPAVRARSW